MSHVVSVISTGNVNVKTVYACTTSITIKTQACCHLCCYERPTQVTMPKATKISALFSIQPGAIVILIQTLNLPCH